jgi:hypothetical protein
MSRLVTRRSWKDMLPHLHPSLSEDELLDGAQEVLDSHRCSEKGIARNCAGEEKIALGDEVAQAKQWGVAQLAIALQLLCKRFTIVSSGALIDNDQIGMKPARDLQSEGGVVFLMDGKAAGIFESAAHRAGESRLVIDEENFLAPFRSHAFGTSIGCANALEQAGDNIDAEGENDGVEGEVEDAVKQHEAADFARGDLHSKTWQVMPMANQK